VTRVLHAGGTITAVETNGRERLPVDRIVSTIPLPQLAALFDPPLSADLVADAAQLRFRGLRIVALCLDRPAVTRSATVYFPDRSLPFTRVFEPRNRSAAMSPPGQTSLVAEIPCAETDPVWTQSDESLTAEIARVLASLHGFRPDQVTATAAVRASGAYPVLDLDGERRAQRVRDGLGDFRNLDLAGRSGRFEYAWIHGLLREGRRIVEQMS
jgi:protoporphyrinogen oxidase